MKRKGEILPIGKLTDEILENARSAAIEDTFIPHADVWESSDAWHVHIYLPGMDSKDVHLQYNTDYIIISGKRKKVFGAAEAEVKIIESQYGRFQRRIKMNNRVDMDKIHVQMDNGVLSIKLIKRQETDTLPHNKVA